MIDYTLVVGVDAKHLQQLAITWTTWKRHKPSLLKHPMLIFFDRDQVTPYQIHDAVDHPDLRTTQWPEPGWIKHEGGNDKWTDPQRYRMLSGFVHVPPVYVSTRYWLKLDTDTVATGQDDWIDDAWFENDPAIVAQGWGFTKPPEQMLKLDAWVEANAGKLSEELEQRPPLKMVPKPGEDKLKHKRIISWCGFFDVNFTGFASDLASASCGWGKLPVPSQDGYLWYLAARLGREVNRVDMKRRGWEHWSTMFNIRQAADGVIKC